MRADVKAKWVAALRSGNYIQAQGGLSLNAAVNDSKPRMCCLGVLCDLYAQETKGVEWYPDSAGGAYNALKIGGLETSSFGFPPSEVLKWSELGSYNGALPQEAWAALPGQGPGNPLTALSHFNDAGDASFEEIADLIEEYL